jgi:regulator of cell morphogenesis and NO signaling
MQLVSLYENQNIADIVRIDYRTAEVFREYGINYCCKGNQPLQEVCSQKNLIYVDVVRKLNQVSQTVNLPLDLQFHKWKTDFLIDYIVNIHHAYLRQTLPQLEADLQHFLAHHQNEYPQLKTVLAIHAAICILMDSEHEQQEDVLFPYIKQIYSAYRRHEPYGKLLVRTLRKPMNMPNGDEEQLNQYLTTLRQLTGNYRVTEGKCTGYDVLIKRLHELDNQLVLHKHLENNIIFPAAIAMEQELLKT